jgi:hypothetical protein
MRYEDVRLGMRVRVPKVYNLVPELDTLVGIIINIEDHGVSVEFNKPFSAGHSCNGKSKEKQGRNFYRHANGDMPF